MSGRPRSGPKRHCNRAHATANAQLLVDYFCETPLFNDKQFRGKYRMMCHLLLRIVDTLRDSSPYFCQRNDAFGKEGFSSLHKCSCDAEEHRLICGIKIWARCRNNGYWVHKHFLQRCDREFWSHLLKETHYGRHSTSTSYRWGSWFSRHVGKCRLHALAMENEKFSNDIVGSYLQWAQMHATVQVYLRS